MSVHGDPHGVGNARHALEIRGYAGRIHQDRRARRLEQLPSATVQGIVPGRHALGEAHQFRPELDADGSSVGIPVDGLQVDLGFIVHRAHTEHHGVRASSARNTR